MERCVSETRFAPFAPRLYDDTADSGEVPNVLVMLKLKGLSPQEHAMVRFVLNIAQAVRKSSK